MCVNTPCVFSCIKSRRQEREQGVYDTHQTRTTATGQDLPQYLHGSICCINRTAITVRVFQCLVCPSPPKSASCCGFRSARNGIGRNLRIANRAFKYVYCRLVDPGRISRGVNSEKCRNVTRRLRSFRSIDRSGESARKTRHDHEY